MDVTINTLGTPYGMISRSGTNDNTMMIRWTSSACATLCSSSSMLFSRRSSTPWRTCCEVRVMLCMTFFFCAPLQSAGSFILEGDWTPTKTNLYYSPPIEVGVLSPFKIKIRFIPINITMFFAVFLFIACSILSPTRPISKSLFAATHPS